MKTTLTLTQEEVGQIIANWVAQSRGSGTRCEVHFYIEVRLDRFDNPIGHRVNIHVDISDDGYKPADPVFVQPASSGIGGQDQPAANPADQPET